MHIKYHLSGFIFWTTFIAGLILSSCSGVVVKEEPTPEQVTLRFAVSGEKALYEALVESYHKRYENVSINLISYNNEPMRGGNNFAQEFNQADVVRANVELISEEIIQTIAPLDIYLATDKEFPLDDMFPGALEALKKNGKQMGIPAGIAPMVMFYDQTRFQIAEVTPPPSDYSLNDLLLMADAINNQDTTEQAPAKFAYGFCTYPMSSDPMIFVYLFGGSLVDNIENPTKPTLNLPENVNAVQWYASLWSEYKLAPPVSDNSFEIYRYISGVKCGFWISWLDMAGYSGNLALKPRALPLPKINQPFNVATLDGYFIPQSTAHPEEAWQWITYLLQNPQVAGGQIPPLESQIATSHYTNQISSDVLEIARTLSSNTHFIGIQYTENSIINQLGTLFGEAVSQVVKGETDAKSALDAAQREAEKLFLETK